MISIVSSAQANVCNLRQGSFDTAVRINGLPGYFFKVHPDGKHIAFIENGNRLIELSSGDQYQLPGGVDPVWSPDGKLLTHPGESEGMNFHHADAAIAAAKRGSPQESVPTSDPRLQGVYQSVGQEGNTYSVLTDTQGASYGKYEIRNGVVTPVGEMQQLCANIPDFPSDLPMLSKDGKYLSVYDSNSRSTKIFNVTNGSCSLAVDLGFPTGKVSFNADSSQITFHLDQFGEFDDGWFSGISKDKVKNVVALKLTKSGERLVPGDWSLVSRATNAGDGGYYPDYDAAGNIYYLEDQNNFFQFVKVRQNQLEWFPFDQQIFRTSGDCENCVAPPTRSPMEILSSMWGRVCDQAGINMTDSPLHVTAIDPVECRAMVNRFWTRSLGVPKERLLNSCPRMNTEAGRVVGVWDTNRMASAEQLFNSRCLMCHSRPMDYDRRETIMVMTGPQTGTTGESFTVPSTLPKIDLNENDADTIERMRRAITSGTMPRGSSFTSDEQSMVDQFLERKLIDLPDSEEADGWSQTVNRYTPENLAVVMAEELQSATSETPDAVRMRVNCFYGNTGCENYLRVFESQIQSLPAEEREKQLTRMKCSVLTGITARECFDWFKENPEVKGKKEDDEEEDK